MIYLAVYHLLFLLFKIWETRVLNCLLDGKAYGGLVVDGVSVTVTKRKPSGPPMRNARL